MKSSLAFSLPFLLLAGACGNQPGNGDPQESPSTTIPENRLIDDAPAGNGAMSDAGSGVTAVDTQPAGSTSSAPGAGTSGEAGAGQATGGADGGRSLGDR